MTSPEIPNEQATGFYGFKAILDANKVDYLSLRPELCRVTANLLRDYKNSFRKCWTRSGSTLLEREFKHKRFLETVEAETGIKRQERRSNNGSEETKDSPSLTKDQSYVKNWQKNAGSEEFALATYYWFHAFCHDPKYAEQIDQALLTNQSKKQKHRVEKLIKVKKRICQNRGQTAIFYIPQKTASTPLEQPLQTNTAPETNASKITDSCSTPTVRPPIRFTPTKANKDNPFHEELVTYQGRKELLDQLESFASNEDALKVWAISGVSGSGKTRLSHQWMKESKTMQDWDQIILGVNHDRNNDHKRKFWEKWTPARSTLLVIDYLYVYADALDAMLKQCMALREKHMLTDKKVRILLIDHVFPKTLDELLRDNRMDLGDYLSKDECHNLFFSSQPLDLDAINDLDIIMPLILREAAGAEVDDILLQRALDHLGTQSMKEQKAWHPLFAIITGYTLKKAQKEGKDIDITAWNRRQLIEYYLTKDTRLPWKLENDRVNGIYASAFIAVATARRGAGFEFLKQHKAMHPPLAAPVSYTQVKKICKSILSIPEIDDRLPPFEPDILGETFFLLFLEAMHEDDDLRDAFKKPFIAMLSQGNERVLLNDAQKFIGFIINLTRNLCNDNQNHEKLDKYWYILENFLNPKDFPDDSPMQCAVKAALLEGSGLIWQTQLTQRSIVLLECSKKFEKQIDTLAALSTEISELLTTN